MVGYCQDVGQSHSSFLQAVTLLHALHLFLQILYPFLQGTAIFHDTIPTTRH